MNSGDDTDGLLVAAMGQGDAYAIGNSRANNFVLRTRATKRVGITPESQQTEVVSQQYRPARKVFEEHHGGGKTSLGFDDFGALSAALPDERPGRKPVLDRKPPRQRL